MPKDKTNINKLKEICSQLTNRDVQLKINEKILWNMYAQVENTEKIVLETLSNKDNLCRNTLEKKLEEISVSLSAAIKMVSSGNCKKVE